MILIAMEDGRGINQAGEKIYINPALVVGIEEAGNDTTSLRTTSYCYLVKGKVDMVAAMLMMPEMLDRAGIKYDELDELEVLIKEKFA
jgi:hypothetical protein